MAKIIENAAGDRLQWNDQTGEWDPLSTTQSRRMEAIGRETSGTQAFIQSALEGAAGPVRLAEKLGIPGAGALGAPPGWQEQVQAGQQAHPVASFAGGVAGSAPGIVASAFVPGALPTQLAAWGGTGAAYSPDDPLTGALASMATLGLVKGAGAGVTKLKGMMGSRNAIIAERQAGAATEAEQLGLKTPWAYTSKTPGAEGLQGQLMHNFPTAFNRAEIYNAQKIAGSMMGDIGRPQGAEITQGMVEKAFGEVGKKFDAVEAAIPSGQIAKSEIVSSLKQVVDDVVANNPEWAAPLVKAFEGRALKMAEFPDAKSLMRLQQTLGESARNAWKNPQMGEIVGNGLNRMREAVLDVIGKRLPKDTRALHEEARRQYRHLLAYDKSGVLGGGGRVNTQSLMNAMEKMNLQDSKTYRMAQVANEISNKSRSSGTGERVLAQNVLGGAARLAAGGLGLGAGYGILK